MNVQVDRLFSLENRLQLCVLLDYLWLGLYRIEALCVT